MLVSLITINRKAYAKNNNRIRDSRTNSYWLVSLHGSPSSIELRRVAHNSIVASPVAREPLKELSKLTYSQKALAHMP